MGPDCPGVEGLWFIQPGQGVSDIHVTDLLGHYLPDSVRVWVYCMDLLLRKEEFIWGPQLLI